MHTCNFKCTHALATNTQMNVFFEKLILFSSWILMNELHSVFVPIVWEETLIEMANCETKNWEINKKRSASYRIKCDQIGAHSWPVCPGSPKQLLKRFYLSTGSWLFLFFKYMKCYGKMWLVSLMWWTETLCISEISAGFKHWRWKIGEKNVIIYFTQNCATTSHLMRL